jgi:hypothetical protein
MLRETSQFLALIVSILVVIALCVLSYFKKEARFFYFSFTLGWIPGIIYYLWVILTPASQEYFLGYSASDLSPVLRLYQYIMFGSWFFLNALDYLYAYFHKRNFKKQELKSKREARERVGKS